MHLSVFHRDFFPKESWITFLLLSAPGLLSGSCAGAPSALTPPPLTTSRVFLIPGVNHLAQVHLVSRVPGGAGWAPLKNERTLLRTSLDCTLTWLNSAEALLLFYRGVGSCLAPLAAEVPWEVPVWWLWCCAWWLWGWRGAVRHPAARVLSFHKPSSGGSCPGWENRSLPRAHCF